MAELRSRDPVARLARGPRSATSSRSTPRSTAELEAALDAARRRAPSPTSSRTSATSARRSTTAAAAAALGAPGRGAARGRGAERGAARPVRAAIRTSASSARTCSTPTAARSRSRRASRRRFPDRVRPTPISEAAIVGSATGFALEGGKAIAEIMFGDFVALAADQLANSAAKHHYISRGESPVNLVVRVPMGGGRGYGPTHSQSLEKMFFGIPGLRVVAVSSFTDPYALLWNAVAADPGPVLFVENKTVYAERAQRRAGEQAGRPGLPRRLRLEPLRRARRRRPRPRDQDPHDGDRPGARLRHGQPPGRRLQAEHRRLRRLRPRRRTRSKRPSARGRS